MTQEIIFQQHLGLCTLELNRPEKLNSLNLEMIRSLTKIFQMIEEDSQSSVVYLKAKGEKAFCAGGDILSLYQAMKETRHEEVSFFDEEYSLDYKIHSFKKPVLCYAGGICMGGGMGLFVGARHRIVDETTVMAMPEISIGLFPDVGATYFLNQLSSPWGMVLGLTGMRLPAYMAIKLGLADWLMNSGDKDKFEKELQDSPADYLEIIKKYSQSLSADQEQDFHLLNQEMMSLDLSSLEAFHSQAKKGAQHPVLQQAFNLYLKGSPTSAAVIYRQLKTGAKLSMEQAFEREKRMAKCFLKHHDFKEGIRALLVDKDKNPQWRPSSLELVSDEVVNAHFS